MFRVPNRSWTRATLGFAASFAGDLNRDGRDELAFAAAMGGESESGAAFVFSGRSERILGELSIVDADLVVETTRSTVDRGDVLLRFAGLAAVRPAGDVDGDGFDDALLPARGTKRRIDGRWRNTGAVGVLYGDPKLFERERCSLDQVEMILVGHEEGWLGHPAVDRGGDLDGDGCAEILVNDPYYLERIGGIGDPQYRGRLWIVRGGRERVSLVDVQNEADLVLLPDTRVPGMFGYTWTTGDWNGDGRLDVVVGDHYAGDSDRHEHAGITYLFYNGSSFTFEPLETRSSRPPPRE